MSNELLSNRWTHIDPQRGTHQYWKKLGRSKRTLDGLGILPNSEVFMTENDEEAALDGRVPAVKQVLGFYACRLMTEHGFRLSTPEEIERQTAEQRQSENYCRATTQAANRESSLHLTSAFLEAAAQLGPKRENK